MAVLINSVSDTLNQTNSVPANTSFTLMGDCCVAVDRGTSPFQLIVAILDGAFSDGVTLVWNEGVANPVMRLIVSDAGAGVLTYNFRTRPEAGRPFCWYLKCSGTGTDLIEAGWRYPGGEWKTGNATLGASIAAPTQIIYGQVASFYYAIMRHQNIRTWTRALSASELMSESESDVPIALNGLHSWCPLTSAANVTDLSRNGRNMTTGGTLDTNPLLFLRQKTSRALQVPVPYEAPVGGVFQILAGRKFSLAGMAGLAGD